ncbi:hypothetical protein V8C42DRAFT_335735 [Trichoderma barbatum]
MYSTRVSVDEIYYSCLGLLSYQIILAAFQFIMRWKNLGFYEQLKYDFGWKYKAYFVFIIGFLVTVVTVPFCAEAYVSNPTNTDGRDTLTSMTSTAKVCLGARGVLWVSELPLLSYSPGYVTHHILSLSSLAMVMLNNLPRRPLYLIYAGLITEIFSDATALLRFHGLSYGNSRLYTMIAYANALSLVAFRILPAVAVTIPSLIPANFPKEQAYIASITFYCAWLMRNSFIQLRNTGLVNVVWARPAHLLLGGKVRISLYRLLLGLSMAITQISVAIFYCLTVARPLTKYESRYLAINGVGTVLVGLTGAKLTNSLMTLSQETRPVTFSAHRLEEIKCIRAQKSEAHDSSLSTINSVRTFRARSLELLGDSCSLNGISIQGGLLFAALWLIFCPTALSAEKNLLLSSAALSLPLGESLGRIGCFFAGCCGSRRDKDGKPMYLAVQLLASTINMVAFLGLATAVATTTLRSNVAGTVAVVANAAIRLNLDPLRDDAAISRWSKTSLFAASQLLLGCFLMVVASPVAWNSNSALCTAIMTMIALLICARALRDT